VETITLQTPFVERTYRLFGPVPGSPPGALVICLHGTGGSGLLAAQETELHTLGREVGFSVAYPDAGPVRWDRPTGFLSNPQRWNDGSTSPTDFLHHETDDVQFLRFAIADAIGRTHADRRRIYLTGFSNGAGMTFRMAAEARELFAAIAPIAGYCPANVPLPARPISTLFITGEADPLVLPKVGLARLPWFKEPVPRPGVFETLQRWFTHNQCHTQAILDSEIQGVQDWRYPPLQEPGVECRVMLVSDLGHHWPGGRAMLNPRIGGPPSNRLNANETIWKFFERHRLD
jgi:polyhydroxybutyrate depolymerase